jgi:DMSO/TMAO reductase YedYZ molybdopterin-dependent catalytic subunit
MVRPGCEAVTRPGPRRPGLRRPGLARPGLRTLGDRYGSPLHETRTAAWLGIALGVSFGLCFATGVWSHLAQDPPGWFTYPARPAGLYRITQGVHVTTGTAAIPLLLAKLWVVHPRLVEWPPARSVLHAVERLALVPLVGGGLFLLVSGTANVARWYPWSFFFPRAHFWAAWITIGALIVHIGAKASVTVAALRRQPGPAAGTADAAGAGDGAGAGVAVAAGAGAGAGVAAGAGAGAGAGVGVGVAGAGDRVAAGPADLVRAAPRDRRAFLGGIAVASGTLVAATAGGTLSPLGSLSVLAQRRPGLGPQGLPVNKSAAAARVVELARDPGYRLVVEGAVDRRTELTLADLRSLPQRRAELPIACVEGWSESARWQGVPVRDVLALVGAREGASVSVESLQPRGLYRASELNPGQARDADTLLALDLEGEPLHIDHGYPVRLIGPARPGVLQTKWVARLVVR